MRGTLPQKHTMTQDEIKGQIRESISRITGIPADDVGERASFQKDLGLD